MVFAKLMPQKGFVNILSILILLFVLAGIPLGIYLVQHPQILKSRADYLTCSQLYVQVSADKKNWSDTALNLPAGATKYYLKSVDVNNHYKPCSTAFDFNDITFNNHKFTLPYHSDKDGIARIDIVGASNGSHQTQVKPHGQDNNSWSNIFTYTLNNGPFQVKSNQYSALRNADVSSTVDLTRYYNFKPGNIWIYEDSVDADGDSTYNPVNAGHNRIQVENEENIQCGTTTFPVFPVRYTIDNINAYAAYGLNNTESVLTRNFMVDPSFNYKDAPSYNNYVWMLSNKFYRNQTISQDSLYNLPNPNSNTQVFFYESTLADIPGYNWGLKNSTIPYIFLGQGTSYTAAATDTTCPPKVVGVAPANSSPLSSWEVRVEKDTIPDTKQYGLDQNPYSGQPAIRIDYFEGGNPLLTNICDPNGPNIASHCSNYQFGLVRESWYFVQNVGPVLILGKEFSNHYNRSYAKTACIDDIDCNNDTMLSPQYAVSLTQYYQNPQLQVTVSTDKTGVSVPYSTNLTVTKGIPYYIKIIDAKKNVPYSGYVEGVGLDSKGNIAGNIFKYNWYADMEGIISVPAMATSHQNPGTYLGKDRVWIPNDTQSFPGEAITGSNSSPWSNTFSVTVK